MKKQEWTTGLDHIDPALVEQYVKQKETLTQKKRKRDFWLRLLSLGACFVLILGTAIIIPLLNTPNNDVPSISTMTSGIKITGKQEVVYGNPSSGNEGDGDMIAPGFEIQTVIEAEVIEVLPDTYYNADRYDQPLHIAKLRVVDRIRGDGLPEEIYLCYPYYNTNVFKGYERFIMSLEQIGIDNYMLINDTQSRVDYFSNMFEVCFTRDLGYGSVIAFNNGKVDAHFWDKADHLTSKVGFGKDYFSSMLDDPHPQDYYPATRNATIRKVKSNILELANDKDNWHVSTNRYNYVTADDVFISEEAKEIQTYVQPSETDIFMHDLTVREDRVIAEYTRIINGFRTDEVIWINGYNGENGNVRRSGVIYTAEDLAKVPNIGEVLANMKLAELEPPHIKISNEMRFSHSNATGVYRNIDGNVYGIIRVMWYYNYSEIRNAYQKDDMYYLYDEDGDGSIVERNQLKQIIGNDSFIQEFSYNSIIAWD